MKTQRALNDYRKSEYPHYKDELTKLKYIGSITAQRLREIQAHLGPDVPFSSIETGGGGASLKEQGMCTGGGCWGVDVTTPDAVAAEYLPTIPPPPLPVCSVEHLKQLMIYADLNRQVENKVWQQHSSAAHCMLQQ